MPPSRPRSWNLSHVTCPGRVVKKTNRTIKGRPRFRERAGSSVSTALPSNDTGPGNVSVNVGTILLVHRAEPRRCVAHVGPVRRARWVSRLLCPGSLRDSPNEAASGETKVLTTAGAFALSKQATDAMDVRGPVFWDSANGEITLTSSDTMYVGRPVSS